jgi:hypothetical protein
LFISHERRELVHFNVTASPTAAWIWRQGMEATAWGRQPRYLIHDRRPHRRIELETPVPSLPTSHGDIVSQPILGGLHHVYARAA